MEKTEKFCQSCGMPLNEKGIDRRGTNSDGSKSGEYCNLCYLNGEFVNPNMTYDEMLAKGLQGIDKSEGNRFAKWLIKKSYPSLLKKCKRWN